MNNMEKVKQLKIIDRTLRKIVAEAVPDSKQDEETGLLMQAIYYTTNVIQRYNSSSNH